MSTRPIDVPVNAGRITAPDENYPDGSAKNDTTGVAGDGTPFEKALLNDLYGEQQAKLFEGGITPSGNSETALVSDQVDAMRRFTILPYVATLDYLVNGYARGSDGNLYQCLVANGPASAVVDPITDVANFWVLVTPKNPRDNLLINGDFQVAQRGVSFPAVGSLGEYTLDRMRFERTGEAEYTVTQDTDIPAQSEASDTGGFSFKVDVTTLDSSIDTNNRGFFGQRVEGYNIKHLLNREITHHFWVKAIKTGIYCVAFQNSGVDRSYVVEYTIDNSDTWEKKSITITMHDGASGAWDFTNGIGLSVDFTLVAGANFQTTPDAWQTGNFLATANQVNGADSLSNDFRVALVKLEAGNGPTAFKHRSFGEELALCLRYFEKSYDYEDAPGDIVAAGAHQSSMGRSGTESISVPFSVPKRTTPAIVFYNPTDGASGNWEDISAAVPINMSSSLAGTGRFTAATAGAIETNVVQGHWTARSEL